LKPILNKLEGQSIRVATMCSGTESPLIALNIINDSLKALIGKSFQFEHVFSCEIVPWKQAYIERNFMPPLIFSDITELLHAAREDFQATTAYGAKVDVPGDIDIIVAGTSCVDFSRKNKKRKSIDDIGESGDTFRALLAYCDVRRPTIVIVENVCSAPWKTMVKMFNEIGYDADAVEVSSSDFYIPHIRNRGYMICIDRKPSGNEGVATTSHWVDLMDKFRRRASAPVTECLLPEDDTRVLRARSGIGRYDKKQVSKEKNWMTCKERGDKERRKMKLGMLRPLTRWTEAGVVDVPEGVDKVYFRGQTKRVWEFYEIAWLRNALQERGSFDTRFKTRCWDVSQNIDLQKDTHPFGITPCITPTGDVLVTNQGRALTGYESLSLQGLPIDDLSFTLELNRDLLDLAGNAMTATVVGSALLAALISAGDEIKHPISSPQPTGPKEPTHLDALIDAAVMEDDDVVLGAKSATNMDELMHDAELSASYCRCEGPYITSQASIKTCTTCHRTVCQSCAGALHTYDQTSITSNQRMSPIEFENRWRHHFPAAFRICRQPDLKSLFRLHSDLPSSITDTIISQITEAFKEPMTFEGLQRGSCWKACYSSATAALVLSLQKNPEWQLFVKPERGLPANSRIRTILNNPIARADIPNHSLHETCQNWHWFIPTQETFDVVITELGESVPSWRARAGLLEAADETLPRKLFVQSTSPLRSLLGEDLSGAYNLVDNCGTPCDVLYVRPQSAKQCRLYLFLDCSSIGDPKADRFVFARKLPQQNQAVKEELLAALPAQWRPWASKPCTTIKIQPFGTWITSENFQFDIKAADLPVHFLKPTSARDVLKSTDDCSQAVVVLAADFNIDDGGSRWTTPESVKINDRSFWRRFSSVLLPLQSMPTLNEWSDATSYVQHERCSRCAPSNATLRWKWDNSNESSAKKQTKLVSYEDAREAGQFERQLKQRPSLFTIRISPKADDISVQIGVNITGLLHRASAQLEHLPGKPTVTWRLLSNHEPGIIGQFPRFTIPSNNSEKLYDKPLDLQVLLRPEQLRSLEWMRQRESDDAMLFPIEAIEEAILPAMHWRAEARVQKPVQLKGGVLADRVGYGKTGLILALVESDLRDLEAVSSRTQMDGEDQALTGLIPLVATLVIVPKQMPQEWLQEIKKFLPQARFSEHRVVVLDKLKDIKDLTIHRLQMARIVVVNWNVLDNNSYIEALAGIAAMPEPSSTKGRSFSTWMQSVTRRVVEHVPLLEKLGNARFDKELAARFEETANNSDFQAHVPTKRTRGAKYIPPNARKSTGRQASKAEDIPPRPAGYGSQGHWTKRSNPLLHMFRWRRVVVDEFPYLTNASLALIVSLQAERRWILSGTPKLTDFMEIKRIAELLGTDLGPDAIPEGISSTRLQQLLNEKTNAEAFHTYREIKSTQWHEARHRYGQRFVDTFMRQNEPDVSSIQVQEHLRPSVISPEHRVLYEETLRHFNSKGMEFIKPDRASSAQERRICALMASCDSPEEALLKDALSPGEEIPTFTDLEKTRQSDVEDCKDRLTEVLARCWSLRNHLREAERQVWNEWEKEETDLGDTEATTVLHELLALTKKTTQKQRGNAEDLRKAVVKLREECRGALLASIRGLRYIQAIVRLRKGTWDTNLCDGLRCHGTCDSKGLVVLPMCGHIACQRCLDRGTDDGKCVSNGCSADLDTFGLTKHADITQARLDVPDSKMKDIVSVLKGLPNEDQALVFVQGDAMTDVVSAGLTEADIEHRVIKSSVDHIGNLVNLFRASSDIKALILNFESGAGLNVQNANHVLFVTPFLAESSEEYHACMEQAIGRAVRPGQTKPVHIYRFVTLNTIDVDILEKR
ncbi:hypothetical protein NA57DRAFT_7963, partial [Rhizodiscina lignyota]